MLIVGTLGFLIFQKKSSTSTKTTSTNQANGNTASGSPFSAFATTTPATNTSATGSPSGIYRLSNNQVVSPAYFFKGSGIAYFDLQGQLHRNTFNQDGSQLTLADKLLDVPSKTGFSRVLWPNAAGDWMLEFNQNGQKSWSYYNYNSGAYTDLPPQVESVDWMPDGTHIAYVWVENGKASLNISDPDTKNWKAVGDMWENDDQIYVSPDGKNIAYVRTQNSDAVNPINMVSVDGKTWTAPVKDGNNSTVLWSPDGQKFLFAKKDPSSQNYQLWVYNLLTGAEKNLQYYTTPEKATWSKDSAMIYIAVPLNGGVQAGSLTLDEIMRVNTITAEQKEYKPGVTQSIDGRDLFLSPDGSQLFFRNAQDGYLYYLDLNKQ